MDVRMPDGTVITNVPEGITQSELTRRLEASRKPAAPEKRGFAGAVQGAEDLIFGGARGIRDVIDTGAEYLAGVFSDSERERVKRLNEAGRKEYESRLGNSTLAQVGRVGGNITATAPVGGALAAPLRAVAPAVGGAAPAVNAAADALATGGFRAGGMSGLSALPVRMAGGAATGAASAGLVNPDDAAMGAAIGALLPPAISGVGAAGGAVARALRPEEVNAAERLSKLTGVPAEELLARIKSGNIELVPGSRPTTAQAGDLPSLSRVELGLRQLRPDEFKAAMSAQDDARRALLRTKVADADGMTAAQAATAAGDLIAERGTAARNATKEAAKAKAGAVDPANASGLQLPRERFQQVYNEFFGSGMSRAPSGDLPSLYGTIMDATAERSPQAARLVKDAKAGVNPANDTLQEALRKWGGINTSTGGGEVRDLTQSALSTPSVRLGPMFRKSGGLDLNKATERAWEAGYIDVEDPRVLLDALRNEANGTPVFSVHGDTALAGARGAREVQPLVTWDDLRRLRSRAGQITVDDAGKPEAAAARQFKDLLDETRARVAAGEPPANSANALTEYFPPDMQRRASESLAAWRDYYQRFDTGPARKLFQRGSDGLPNAQGAEAYKAFIGEGPAQRENAQALRRMFGDDQIPIREAQRAAIADLQEYAMKRETPISPAAFDAWVKRRSEMLDVLFPENKVAHLKAIRDDLVRAEKAARNANAGGGSVTADKIFSTGLLSSPALDRATYFVPGSLLKAGYTGTLGALRQAGTDRAVRGLTPLMLDANAAENALSGLLSRNAGGDFATGADMFLPWAYRAAPVIPAGR